MSRGNRDQQSTVDERCDGCDRGIDQVYLDAGTSFDVWLNDAARSDQPAPSHGQYHFCGTCVFEVLGLVDEHFEADYEMPMSCEFCGEPTGSIPAQFTYQPHGTDTTIAHFVCSSCLPIVQQFCEQIPEDQPDGDTYKPREPSDRPYTDAKDAVFRYAKPYNQLMAGDRFVLEARQRATEDFPEQRLKIAASIADRGRNPEDSFEAPLSDIRVLCGNWIGIQPTDGTLELDYGTGTRQLRIRFDDAAAPDNRYRSFEGYVTQIAPPTERTHRRPA
jgi:hypothetical protein